MATPEREGKRIQRQLRGIPVEEVGPRVAADEQDALWCLVVGRLVLVPADGGTCVTEWDDFLEYAQFERYVRARPERVHPTHESALAFVRSHFGHAWRLAPARPDGHTAGMRKRDDYADDAEPPHRWRTVVLGVAIGMVIGVVALLGLLACLFSGIVPWPMD